MNISITGPATALPAATGSSCAGEGLTVFRDQSFSEDLQSAAVRRIDDVAVLKTQFPEDSGPLSHPPRPDHFVEINNFYTATVYEKGAKLTA